MNADAQIELFPRENINAESSIQAALGAFLAYLPQRSDRPASKHTVRAFRSDVRLLGEYLGIGQPVGDIGTQDLNDFLEWMLDSRQVACSLKTYNRRVTALKAFFGYLQTIGVIPDSPASGIVYVSYSSRLPSLPTGEQIEKALTVSEAIYEGEGESKKDSRPHLLLTLLLDTGIKKSEVMTLVPYHIDRDDPEAPYLHIRYREPNMRHKDRKMPLKTGWLEILDQYLEEYEPNTTLFTCTARNLEYILSEISQQSGLKKGLLSFENLRWYWAREQYQSGVAPHHLVRLLGIAENTWPATKSKLEKLSRLSPGGASFK